MEIESEVSMSGYYSRFFLFNDDSKSNPPYKKLKYSPAVADHVIEISDSSKNPIFGVKLSPIILHLRCRCSRNTKNKKKRRFASPPLKKKKKKSSSSIEEITKGSFNAAVLKSFAAAVTHDGGVKKSSTWVKSQLLGRGSYGSVYLATSKSDKDKKTVAIKSAEISLSSSLMNEKRILTRLLSPFVVRCYGDEIARESVLFGGERTNYNLILEYCSGQSLADLIQTNGGGLSEKDVKSFARDILYGLFYIHSENIIHCDIKPDNILLTPVDNRIGPNGYLTKIADFGVSMEKGSIQYGNGSGHERGTTRYMAPELISHGIVDYGVDTWAFGCTVLEMLTGQVAWGEHSDLGSEDLVNLIGQSGFIPYVPDWLSVEAQDFLSRCLVKEPGSRWGIHALINHPFFSFEVEESHNGFVYD